MPATNSSPLPPITSPAHWVDAPGLLIERLRAWQGQPTVAMDTEFVRERTYWPRLALVQMAVPGEVLLVDATVDGMAEALRPFLADPGVVKIMHSASEDLQAFKVGVGVVPRSLYDTQVGAALAGLGAGLSYQKLVEAVSGVVLEKGETRSDWLRRPLSESQKAYAADDVRYLHAIHAEIERRLAGNGRRAWLIDDCERAVRQAEEDAPEAWPHLALRSAQFLDADGQARLLRLLRWRDEQARASDRPRSWILDNELAVALARKPPTDPKAFGALLDAHPKAPRRARHALWETLTAPLSEAEREIPLAATQDEAYKRRLRKLQDAVAEETRRLDLPEGLLASRRHLETLMTLGTWPDALDNWRRELLAARLAPLLEAATPDSEGQRQATRPGD